MFLTQEQLDELLLIVEHAGDIIVKNYDGEIEVELKEDDTPLTKTDIEVNDFIIKRLQKIMPNAHILSEESAHVPYSERKDWEGYWIVDPLDGTRGFIDRTDDFCICIGYIQNNKPVFGMVYIPMTEVCYYANEDDKAYKLIDNVLERIYVSDSLYPLRVIVGGYSTYQQPTLIEHLKKATNNSRYKIEYIGSAIKVCLIAEGKFDYYPALGVCSEWDTAASSYILKAAGGSVLDLDGHELIYNTKDNYTSPKFIASGVLEDFSKND